MNNYYLFSFLKTTIIIQRGSEIWSFKTRTFCKSDCNQLGSALEPPSCCFALQNLDFLVMFSVRNVHMTNSRWPNEYDRKFWTWPKNLHWWMLTLEHDQKIINIMITTNLNLWIWAKISEISLIRCSLFRSPLYTHFLTSYHSIIEGFKFWLLSGLL